MRDAEISVLVVDDDAGMIRSLAMILGRKGYAITTAEDGPQAIEKVKERPFDVILMDIRMPLMNGVETYRQIKGIRPEAAVIMMTAYAVEDLIQQAVEEGAYAVLYKPLNMDQVFTSIAEARRKGQGRLVLVVDDDPATCDLLKQTLSMHRYQVGIAHTGEAAIAMSRETNYEVIFIDLVLPTINGLETYLRIREINPEVIAVIVTGHRQDTAGLVEEALRNSAYACLYKPFDVNQVLALMDEIWERKRKK